MVYAAHLPLTVATDAGASRFQPEQFRAFANLAEAFFFNADRNGDLLAYDQAMLNADEPDSPRRYVGRTQAESKVRVVQIARRLCEWGLAPGDRVAILSLNRPEWTEAEMAVYAVGGVVVALYVRFCQERLQQALAAADAKFAIVENEEQLRRIARCIDHSWQETAPVGVRHVLSIEDLSASTRPSTFTVDTFSEVLAQEPPEDASCVRYSATRRDDLATIYFTSGSSGGPTGVPVTHGQTLENLYQIAISGLIDYERYEQPDAPQPIVTLLLPERAHAFPARNAQLTATSPARARYPAIIDRCSSQVTARYRDSLRRDLREGGAGIVPMVPKVLIGIEQAVRNRLAGAGGRLVRWIIERQAAAIEAVGTPAIQLRGWRGRLFDRLRKRIATRIRQRIVGPDFEFFISGGAKLPIATAAFLWAIDLPVYEGYGSTESNCPIATNTPRACRLGSVGKVFPGVEAMIDQTTEEIWLRGPNVVQHYWHANGADRSVWTADGWYRTRDVGRLDGEGFLYVADRIDNILVAWNGENVSATAIESRFVAIPYIDTAIVVGHQRPALVALVALNEEAIRAWGERNRYRLHKDLRQDPAVIRLLREEVERWVNGRAAHVCEQVRQLAIIESLAIEDATLTATEKVRRREIERRYAERIEAMYRDRSQWLSAAGPRAPGGEGLGSELPTHHLSGAGVPVSEREAAR